MVVMDKVAADKEETETETMITITETIIKIRMETIQVKATARQAMVIQMTNTRPLMDKVNHHDDNRPIKLDRHPHR